MYLYNNEILQKKKNVALLKCHLGQIFPAEKEQLHQITQLLYVCNICSFKKGLCQKAPSPNYATTEYAVSRNILVKKRFHQILPPTI